MIIHDTLKKLQRVLFWVLFVSIFSTFGIIDVQSDTVNDVRELLGRQRLEGEINQDIVEKITRQYMTTDINNIAAKMFELGDKIQGRADTDIDRVELMQRINNKSDQFYEAFINNEPADRVLELKTELDSVMSEVRKLREDGYNIDVEFIPNRWTEAYMQVQEIIANINDDFDIGDTGIEMLSPVEGRFEVASPFGSRRDPFERNKIAMHYGLDLNASMGQRILSQWNGIVSNVYESTSYGKVVEVQHGNGLMTRYAHLSEQLVKIGDEVKQYDTIGLAGTTGRSTGPHLHFEVYVDSIIANPIMLYGEYGTKAYYDWAKLNPDQIIDTTDIQNIKNRAESYEDDTEDFYKPIKNIDAETLEDVPPGAIVPKLPDWYRKPEPGVLH